MKKTSIILLAIIACASTTAIAQKTDTLLQSNNNFISKNVTLN